MAHGHTHSHAGHSHASHGHSHGGPAPGPKNWGRVLAVGVVLNTLFVLVEAGFGFYAGSLALLADAGHNLSDVAGLLLAWAAAHLGRRAPTERRTYGLGSTSILAALSNAVLLLVAIGAIAWEAVGRMASPPEVKGSLVIGVALVGLVINGATAWLLHGGREGDLNIRGAYLHMLGDAAVSLGVALAGVGMAVSGWSWLDPIVSLMVVAVIVVGTWGLLRESLDLALHAVPASIDMAAVRRYLAELPQVTEVHDLHVWALSTTEIALTVHLVRSHPMVDDELLHQASDELARRFGITHATIQVECGGGEACKLAPDSVV